MALLTCYTTKIKVLKLRKSFKFDEACKFLMKLRTEGSFLDFFQGNRVRSWLPPAKCVALFAWLSLKLSSNDESVQKH